MTTLRFLGAIDTVTGSRYLLETAGHQILIDCGLYQGPKKLRQRNWQPLPFDVSRLDAVVLTHAHIDHSGYLPRLCNEGYRGPVYCTHGTRDLLQLLLPDAGHLQEEQAEHANRWGYAHHAPALPLYTRQDAERCLDQLVPVAFHERLPVAPGVTATFRRAGHIIGAASVTFTSDVTITFSGDVGRARDPIMRSPEPLADSDYLVVESTYGDRRHPDHDLGDLVAGVISETLSRSGVVVVPAFAVGRAQHLLHLLTTLRDAGRIPTCPVYLDSPMAIDATGIFTRHATCCLPSNVRRWRGSPATREPPTTPRRSIAAPAP
jgi:metallo-beta-lactamase family protein